MERIIGLGFMAVLSLAAQQYTRGVGVYPGAPEQYFGPTLQSSGPEYRNLALHRAAYHSSSYDYNLTAQLVTDGIRETKPPRWVSVSTSQAGTLPRNQREYVLDHNEFTSVTLNGPGGWIQLELNGGDGPPEIDRVDIQSRLLFGASQPGGWNVKVMGSDDGQTWRTLGHAEGDSAPVMQFNPSIPFSAPAHSRFYRVAFEASSVAAWRIGEVSLFDRNRQIDAGGPYNFASAWMSAGRGEEWVYVDLGAVCSFDRVALYWIRAAAQGALEVSDDAANWKTLQPLPAPAGNTTDLHLSTPAAARYVRVLMTQPATPDNYILTEMEVWGHGGLAARPKPAVVAGPDSVHLAGGAWRVQRDSLVAAGGEDLSQPGYGDSDWLVATVPGTVLTSYLNDGAVPDPNFGDNQLMVSDSYFYADFWYRDEFVAPPVAPGQRAWLDFDGVNWKADVFLNGKKLGRIEGAFTRGRFDVTDLLHPGRANALAVRVEKNATPGSVKEKTFDSPDKNGGALGADNPTFHASIGWDWIPVVRGRNTGIWNDVWLRVTGAVTVENPLVTTTLPLPDVSRADVNIQVTLHNNTEEAVSGKLTGHFGDVAFSQPVHLDPSASTLVKLDPSAIPALRLQNPKLWWPNGYGDPSLYSVELSFEVAGRVSDTKRFLAGVRQFTYSEDGGILRIWINGRRFVPRGGNWGFSEDLLRYRAREYDVALRYHRDLNFTMVRNWVGQVGEDAFYEACDRHGIVVWQDFWLANPLDGPNPDDVPMFLRNARDYILKIRNHPAIGLYCGRNEGNPPPPIEDGLRSLIAELHPDLHYIPNSASKVVSGGGPYRATPVKFYFQQRATTRIHSELGMPNIVTLDSVRAMMPESGMWPQGAMWGTHDFSLHGAQGGESFRATIDKSYGGADNVKDWVELAQFVNYDGHRAMFEAQSKNRMGVLLWMSHPAWPSFVWETYDYYFDTSAGYFGSKKGSEPLHIQWNPITDNVEVVNYSGGNQKGLTARVEILNMDGSLKWEKEAGADSAEDSVLAPIHIEYPAGLSPVHFIRLRLTRGTDAISTNVYWRGIEEGDFRALRELPKASVQAATTTARENSRWRLVTTLHNTSGTPALLVRVKAVRAESGDRILPAFYSDNYIVLMPGESHAITTEVDEADTRGEQPRIALEGFNVAEPAR